MYHNRNQLGVFSMSVSHKDKRFLSHLQDIVRSNHSKAKTSFYVNWNPHNFSQILGAMPPKSVVKKDSCFTFNHRWKLQIFVGSSIDSFVKPLFPYVLRGHLWMITLLPIVQKSELMQWWGTKVLRHFFKMAPFWTVDIPIPSPQNQCCILDSSLSFTTNNIDSGVGGFTA